MKTAALVVISVVLLTAVLIGVQVWLAPAPEAVSQVSAPAPAPASPAEPGQQDMFGSVPVGEPVISDAAETEPELPPVEPVPEPEAWTPDPQAVEALRQSRLHGDPRTPPIARRETEREMPTEEELADPELYLQYEARQQQKVYASFVEASKKKISDLEAIIERGKQGGVSPEQLAEGEEKLRRLKEMREQLLAENPELVAEDANGTQAADGAGEQDAP